MTPKYMIAVSGPTTHGGGVFNGGNTIAKARETAKSFVGWSPHADIAIVTLHPYHKTKNPRNERMTLVEGVQKGSTGERRDPAPRKKKTREHALRFQYDSGYVHVFKYDPKEGDYILAVTLDPDGGIDDNGKHRDGRFVELTREQFEASREWQKKAQKKNRRLHGGLHSNN